MISWKSLVKRIPLQIKTSKKDVYDIVFVKDFLDGNTLGETRFHTKQIALLLGQSPKQTIHTYLHEILHAISDTYDAKLTETQILALEKAIDFVLRKNNIFKE